MQALETNRVLSPIEAKAMKLLSSGQNQRVVAGVLGVSESRISQLMAEDWFANQVAENKYGALQKHRELDEAYDDAEKKLQDKLIKQIPLMFKAQDILRALQVVNMAKRKSSGVVDGAAEGGTGAAGVVVNLSLPTQIVNKFSVNINNQVVEVNGKSLVKATPTELIQEIKNETTRPEVPARLTLPSQDAVFDKRYAISAEDL